jgi:hypothetical protein
MAAGNYKDGGRAEMRNERKMADIEKDYKIALAKGKNEGVAKAKYEQRKADAADDYAKATKADRSVTRGAEKAAEAALKEARRTKGVSISNRDNAESFMQKNSKSVAPKINVSETLKGLGVMPAAAEKVATPKSRSAPVRKATPVRKAPPVRQAPPAPPAPPVRQAPPTVTPPAPRGGSAPAAVNPRMIAPRSSNLLTDQAAISRAKPQADARREMTEAKNKRVTALGDFLGNIPTPAIFGSGNAAKSYAERQKKMGYTSGPVKRAAGGAAKARKS